jgi:hypothetical protein
MPYRPLAGRIDEAADRIVSGCIGGCSMSVGGQQIVRDGKAPAFDYANASARLQMAQHRAIEKVPGFDWAGRGVAQIMPPTFPSK